MADQTNIEWCDATWSPWEGCQKVSPACDNCYAEARNKRFNQGANWGPGAPRKAMSETHWRKPLRWQKQTSEFYAEHGRRRRVFPSLCDPFDNAVDREWHERLWLLIKVTPNLDWLLLTKRPQNIEKMLPDFWDEIKGHVWLGTTIEDQKRAHMNIPHLLKHDCAVRFVSCEPLLGPIDFNLDCLWFEDCGDDCDSGYTEPDTNEFVCNRCEGSCKTEDVGIDWVIAGGESGPNARPSNPEWFRSLRDQCSDENVPFLFKQWGEYRPVCSHFRIGNIDISKHYQDILTGQDYLKVGKKKAGRLLDGKIHNEFPEVNRCP